MKATSFKGNPFRIILMTSHNILIRGKAGIRNTYFMNHENKNYGLVKDLKNILTDQISQVTLHKKWSFPLRISSLNPWKILIRISCRVLLQNILFIALISSKYHQNIFWFISSYQFTSLYFDTTSQNFLKNSNL